MPAPAARPGPHAAPRRVHTTPRAGRRICRAAVVAGCAALLLPLGVAAPGVASAAVRGDDVVWGGGPVQEAYARAAERYRVPRSVLLGVSYLQSRWDGHGGAASVSGGYGPMHLTDPRAASAEAGDHHRAGRSIGEGLPERPATVREAAQLTGIRAERLRTDPAANITGGAALLADSQRELGLPPSEDPADWYGAVAAYSGAQDRATATAFADEVFRVLRRGARRVTDSGDPVTLPGSPGLRARRAQASRLDLRAAAPDPRVECPEQLRCTWQPAPYERWRKKDGTSDYGNHDRTHRPATEDVDYIVVHDVEGYWKGATSLVQDPEYVSWHYTLRSSDGQVAQHLRTEDVGWHAGNWYVNAKSVGLEHEGFLTAPDAWYTEAMYRSSARLVRYLAEKYDIPLDRQHILGHDNVPAAVPSAAPGMHTDPGPYWDWAHYFRLLGAPFHAEGPRGGMVTVLPDYEHHRPVYTGCGPDRASGETGEESRGSDAAGPADGGRRKECRPHGSSAVRLHTAPDAQAPLVRNIGLHPDGRHSSDGVEDTGARASTGQRYAVAERRGEWTAIWYLGRKAWFHNPPDRPTAVPARGRVVTPRPGKESVPVYGRAYPEPGAYPDDVPVQDVVPLPYELKAGQQYALGLGTRSSFLWAQTYDPTGEKAVPVRGDTRYLQIQFGHRVAFVKAGDVTVTTA